MTPELKAQIRRNLLRLSACVTIFYCVAVMMTALTPATFVFVSGRPDLSGVPPALFLLGGATGANFAGRLMDRLGRMKVVCAGFLIGATGCIIIRAAILLSHTGLSLVGFVLTGAAAGTVMLARLAGADMYPPDMRGRGISLVLMGAVVGGVLGPLVFLPLAVAHSNDGHMLAQAWLVGASGLALGSLVTLTVQPDPKKIAELIAGNSASANAGRPSSLKEILQRPGVLVALTTAVVAHALMVSLMSLCGVLMVRHGHHHEPVFVAVGTHFVGMFGMVLVSGEISDRMGHTRAMVLGLLIITGVFATLPWVHATWAFALNMFMLGWGWNFAFVAATSELARATKPHERGRLIGFNDVLASTLGAALVVTAGVAIGRAGVVPLAVIGTLVAMVPLLLLSRASRVRASAASSQAA